MCETRQTVEKISHSRWLLNAEKYFTEVTQSVSDARMIPLNWKGNCSSYSKSTNAVKMLFTRTVPCMKLLLSASFNHSKITQTISTIFLPNVSFNCQHRKELDSLYSGGILSPVRLTFSPYVYRWKCEDAIKLDSLVIKSFRQILLQWRTRQSITSSSSSTSGIWGERCLTSDSNTGWTLLSSGRRESRSTVPIPLPNQEYKGGDFVGKTDSWNHFEGVLVKHDSADQVRKSDMTEDRRSPSEDLNDKLPDEYWEDMLIWRTTNGKSETIQLQDK